jgi:hypothetical protein
MTIARYSILATIALAFCIGCGDSSSQPWEKTKSPPAAAKSGQKSDEAVNNDVAADSGKAGVAPRNGIADSHAGTDAHAGLMMPGEASSAVLENDGTLNLGPFKWTVPKTWVRKSPGMMVMAEFSVPHADGDKDNARLTVSEAKGSLEGNIDRWKNIQFSKLDKQSRESFDVSGFKVTLVDYSGAYVGMQMPGAAPAAPHSDFRMIGAVIEIPGQSDMVFIKCYGPEKTMAARADEVKAFIRSMKADK